MPTSFPSFDFVTNEINALDKKLAVYFWLKKSFNCYIIQFILTGALECEDYHRNGFNLFWYLGLKEPKLIVSYLKISNY